MDSVLVGAFKVKDGLFIGDEFAAQDLEFVVANKVTRIVNCASRQVPNHWEPIGVNYLSFSWFDTENQVILDSNDKNFTTIFTFIEQGLESGESVLVHSVRGVSRCVCVVTAYLIRKYHWSLYKSLDFLAFRRPDLNINAGFVAQLGSFEARTTRNTKIARTSQWDQILENPEELVLRNTFLNARLGAATDYHVVNNEPYVPGMLKWNENLLETTERCKNRVEDGFVVIKSCMKGAGKAEKKVPLFSAEDVKEKRMYTRLNFGKGIRVEDDRVKARSSSLNKNDNKLVKEAISAARGMMDNEIPRKVVGKSANSLRNEKRNEAEVEVVKILRPTTAPQKRPPSPKVSDPRAKYASSTKGIIYGSVKRKK